MPNRVSLMDLLLQEFDLEIRDKSGCENLVADHLSRLTVETSTDPLTRDRLLIHFLDEQLFHVKRLPWFMRISSTFLVTESTLCIGTAMREIDFSRR